ncbi:MAG TPA: type I-E CRISPR-associated protein Cse2/CasB [Pyrinomonadaceae bacterium]|nr:type I-E CRISPR-associated protein Cse2/CasB [Pyrinomonadaceae bacterium]HMP66292.1 type I-E CRISPR-associated protein Cse2/CasB [Pyrinomonadaceae bacterium]
MIEKSTNTEHQESDVPIVGYLRGLAKRKDRAALAHLRRGLGRKPGEAMEMYPYVGKYLREAPNRAYERAVFLTSALFADYPEAPQNAGDLGSSVRQIKDKSDSIERRFVALLDADAEDLHYYLRQMIGLLRANDVPVNWERLFKDISNWGSDSRYVQRKWARSFWGSTETQKTAEPQQEGE